MKYKTLSPSLYATADAAQAFFKERLGVRFSVEQPLQLDMSVVTTLHAVTRDHHYLCVDVSESSYTETLDAFVLECKNKCLPVRLYVATPQGVSDTRFKENLQRANANGVGIVELRENGGGSIIHEPLSLSLTGVRPIEFRAFPAKYRAELHNAYSTFLNGNPVKGCAILYDEIENLSRRIAMKADARKLWSSPKHIGTVDFAKAPWASLLDHLMRHLDIKAANTPALNKALLSRIVGMTEHRNEAGHKPGSVAALRQRDRQLRTRFEHATDTLADLIGASRPLKV